MVLGDRGLVEGLQAHTIVDLSTTGAAATREIAAAFATKRQGAITGAVSDVPDAAAPQHFFNSLKERPWGLDDSSTTQGSLGPFAQIEDIEPRDRERRHLVIGQEAGCGLDYEVHVWRSLRFF
ncbi:hypothetical protein ACU4HD_31850 [Cupriavidus basilensis]